MLVVDQLRADVLARIERRLGPRGLKRLLGRGTRYTHARYRHAATFTAPGHAILATGAYPHRTGIVANMTWDWRLGGLAPALFDPDRRLLGVPATAEGEPEDTSPSKLRVATVGDALRAKSPASKVVAVSLKARAAILLGGHTGEAYWFSEVAGKMTSSTYYQRELPKWVQEFNAKGLPELAFGRRWQRSQPPKSYSGEDDVDEEENAHGLGRTFPHPVNGGLRAPGPEFYEAFTFTPFATDYEMAFAKAAVEAGQLGADDIPDLLAISFTATDYAGHAYGPASHEVQDHLFAVDRAVAELLAFLDKHVRQGRFVVVLSSDHGVAGFPEASAKGRRIPKAELIGAINTAASARFGVGEWVAETHAPSVWLNLALASQRNVSQEALEAVAQQALSKVPDVAAVFTRDALTSEPLPDASPLLTAARLSFHPDTSGDLLVIPAERSFWGKYAEKDEATGHGTPWAYDQTVPLAIYGVGVPRRTVTTRVDLADVAPTVAVFLGLDALPGAEGKRLPR